MRSKNFIQLILFSTLLTLFFATQVQLAEKGVNLTTQQSIELNTVSSSRVNIPASGGNVLWDLTHGIYLGYEPANRYTNLVTALQTAGYTVNTTTNISGADLAPYKILVVCLGSAWNSAYTTAERTKIQTFVQNGGGLWILGDNVSTPNANINLIAQTFGITLGGPEYYGSSITNFAAHSIFAGVAKLSFMWFGELTVSSPANLVAWDPNNKGCVAIAQSGSGRVVAIGDINFCENANLANENNQKFSLNIFDWLSAGTSTGPVYIKDFSVFPAYPYNTSSYMQSGAYVGCGPTTGAMILGYYQHVNGLSGATGLLTNPGTGVNEGLNTAWVLHGSAYMNTGADGFGSVYNIEPGIENYGTSRGYKMQVMIHVSPTYDPSSTTWDAYGPYGTSWLNDGDFWTYIGGVWNIDASKFCDFVGVKLAAGIAIFLTIDTNLDGYGDHWVALVGYNKSTLKYAFYDTYSTTVQWADIHYCAAPGTKYDNSISLLRSVGYEGPIAPQTNPPQNVLAMNGYHATIPLAWRPPAGSLVTTDFPVKPGLFGNDNTMTQLYGYSINLAPHDAEFKTESPRLANWTNNETAAPTGYNVYRSTSSGGTYTKIASNIQRLYYRDETASNGTHYYYKVTAVYGTSESAFSNVADATAQTNGYVINSNWTTTAPVLDGVINTSEWSAAVTTNITYPGYSGTVTLYSMNNASKLYFAVNDGRDHALEDDDTFGIFFDDNHDRAWPPAALGGEGLLQLFWDANSASSLNAYMGIYGWWPDHLYGENLTTPPGVAQKISLASGNIHYEGSIDLAASDLKSSPGNTVGILFYIYDGGVSGFDGAWPQETVSRLPALVTGYGWCYAPFCYGDLKLASAPTTVPDISANPTSWNYGSISVGGYADKTFVISNVGTANLNVTTTTLTGTNALEFSIQTGGGAFTLAPGASRNITVRFAPTGSGSKSAALSISSNDPDENPFLVNLSGTGTTPSVPDIASTPTSHNYGAITIGSTSDKSFVISNVGTANLNVTATTLTGTNASEFSIQSGGGTFTLAAGATRNLAIRFSPTTAGSKSAALSISSNDPDENPFLVNLTGTGTAPATGWETPLTVAGSATFTRTFGGASTATDGFDNGLDVATAPPGMTYYAYFQLPVFPSFLEKDIRKWVSPYDLVLEWTLIIANATGVTSQLSWNPATLPAEGTFMLTGSGLNVNMRTVNHASVSGNATLIIKYQKIAIVTMTYSFARAGWYLISLPVTPADNRLSVLFPTALGAYGYNSATGAYLTVTQLEPKKGYWLLIPGAASVNVSGEPLVSFTEHYNVGWHLIGSSSGTSLPIADPDDTPNGAVIAIYGWNPNTNSYTGIYPPGSGVLNQGEGYWLAVAAACNLTIPGAPPLAKNVETVSADLPQFYQQYGLQPPQPPFIQNTALPLLTPIQNEISCNYPNPFNPATTIKYTLSKTGFTGVYVYNTIGQRIRTLAEATQPIGIYEVVWDGRNELGELVPSGIYFYHIVTTDFVETKKMMLLK